MEQNEIISLTALASGFFLTSFDEVDEDYREASK